MSKLNELIAEQCPNGVEYKPLWQVTTWDKRFTSVDRKKQPKIINYPYLLANDLFALQQDSGDVFLLSTGEKTGWTTVELAGKNLCEGEVVTIPWGKSRAVTDCIKYYKGKFVTADNRIATSSDTEVLSNKFLYYWMMSQGDTIDRFYRGSGIKHPSMKDVLEMNIPIPPMEVQNEVVRILDVLTDLTTKLISELKLELATWKNKYSYYRDQVLSGNEEWEQIRIIDMLCQPITDGPHTTPTLVEEGVPFISVDAIWDGKIHFENKRGYITEEFDVECSKKYRPQKHDLYMVKSGSTTGKVAYVDTDIRFNIWSPLAAMRVNSRYSSRFLFHVLQTSNVQDQVKAKSSHGSQPNLSMRALEQFQIKAPSIDRQECIANTLDSMSDLCNALYSSINAEIKLRKKEYEYFRTKMLAFEKV